TRYVRVRFPVGGSADDTALSRWAKSPRSIPACDSRVQAGAAEAAQALSHGRRNIADRERVRHENCHLYGITQLLQFLPGQEAWPRWCGGYHLYAPGPRDA